MLAGREHAPSAIDWTILVAYLAVVLVVGLIAARRRGADDDPFLAGRSIPMWAAAISVVATSLSAATFIGGPQQAYAKDLTYFSANLGGLIAMIVVATVFIPAFYRHRVTSIYQLLGDRWGSPPRRAASVMFLIGRVMASGARLFMVAIPFALVAFGEIKPAALCASIAIITAVATAYTTIGGMRAVIWTDVLQAITIVLTVSIAIVLLVRELPVPLGTAFDALHAEGKLRTLDWSLDPSKSYTVWTAITGFALFSIAAYGTDQDLTQRMLTCRTPRAGAWSMVVAQIVSWPIVLLFLGLGLLLYVFYDRPDLMGDVIHARSDDSRRVFLDFMLTEFPAGVRGLMLAGLFAAALSSLDSALNAMTTSTLCDFGRQSDDAGSPTRRRRVRWVTVAWACALAGFACGCVFWQAESGQTLITFALGVMVYAYSGLLGVFLTALLTRRGSAESACAALVVGFVSVLAMEPSLSLFDVTLAFPWRMAIATTLSTSVCLIGNRPASVR